MYGLPKFDFKPKDHIEIGNALNLIDTEKAAKIAGARFGYLMNGAAMIELALIQHAFSTLQDLKILRKVAKKIDPHFPANPFIPVIPPVMIRPEVYQRTARLAPGEEEERYYLEKDDLYLVGSAEHTLVPLHMDETLDADSLPIRYIGFSTCFRREAGSYGRDTKGILRVHQFDKVEIESFTTPEMARKEQDFFVALQEHLMQDLELPYQVVTICSGEMGGPDERQIDIETWLPGQNRYRETHSADLIGDYQPRRLNTKFRRKNGEIGLVHANDATVFAIQRMIIAILENYQTKAGTIRVPKVLQKYVGRKEIGQ